MEDGKYRILLADDDCGLCAVLQAYLNLQPDMCCCSVAYDGLRALEQAHRHKPDLVLLDIQMPGLNGADFMAELAASPISAACVCWPSPHMTRRLSHKRCCSLAHVACCKNHIRWRC